ncbi:MAG: GAF domain-containing protein [Flavobacteriales bacterium]|nr:GAF domain-containing protein [Flavobacteriales bacterium]
MRLVNKEEKYSVSLKQIHSLIEAEKNQTANLANICSVLKTTFNWWWVGFYFVDGDELVLGPFQGPVACTRIAYGKGVCGTSWKMKETVLVENVHDFPGHIACSPESLSEIVIPVLKDNEVIMVLDVDSDKEAHFDELDKKYLEKLCELISSLT